jgi:quercetin dioxygenase-like cupin family protein
MENNGLKPAGIYNFNDTINYAEGGIVSKNVLKKEKGNISIFAFDKGEGLSEHTAPFDAMVQVIEGKAFITISGKDFNLIAGESIIMPAGQPHKLHAPEKFKMILTMIKE